MRKMCQSADAPIIWPLLPLLSRASFDFLVCVELAWGLPGRLAVTGDSMEAGAANFLLALVVIWPACETSHLSYYLLRTPRLVEHLVSTRLRHPLQQPGFDACCQD